jgi:hypothetical protein
LFRRAEKCRSVSTEDTVGVDEDDAEEEGGGDVNEANDDEDDAALGAVDSDAEEADGVSTVPPLTSARLGSRGYTLSSSSCAVSNKQ